MAHNVDPVLLASIRADAEACRTARLARQAASPTWAALQAASTAAAAVLANPGSSDAAKVAAKQAKIDAMRAYAKEVRYGAAD